MVALNGLSNRTDDRNVFAGIRLVARRQGLVIPITFYYRDDLIEKQINDDEDDGRYT